MAGLQRSAISFRRQGSSGLVWEDRFVSGELKKKEELDQQQKTQQGGEGEVIEFRELRTSRSVGSAGTTRMMERNRSTGGGGTDARDRHRSTGRVSPTKDPPSPKVPVCGFCSVFGKPHNTSRSKTSKRKQ